MTRLPSLSRWLLALFLLSTLPALAQQAEEEERSYFVGYVENKISTPDRQIRIHNIQGVLSSNATIGEITIADRQGIWLKIENARIVWTRTALLAGRLSIDTLAADSIEVIRKPLPAEGLPPPEAGGFQLPELPVSVNLARLDVPRVTFGPDVFGLQSALSVGGRFALADGSLDAALDVTRLDGPGGKLALVAKYSNATRVLDLDLTLQEEANGIVSNVLSIEGKPPIALALKGSGPIDSLDLGLTLDADARRVLDGTTRLRRQAAGIGFDADVKGTIATLVPPLYRSFFGADTSLKVSGVVKDAGGLSVSTIDVASAQLALKGGLDTTPDGFLSRLELDATIDDKTGGQLVLPVPGGATTVDIARLMLRFGGSAGPSWNGALDIDDFRSTSFGAKKVALKMGGAAENIDNPQQRHVSFRIGGAATGIVASQADVAKALGDTIDLDIDGDWHAGQPVSLAKALLSGNGLSVSLAGAIADYAFRGKLAVDAASIAPFSGFAGRDLAGALKLDADGEIKPVSGGFDLTLDGTATDLKTSTSADGLLGGETRITGQVARGETGLAAHQLRLFNDQLSFTADGRFATGTADFNFDAALADLARLTDRASGKLTASGRALGSEGSIGLTVTARVDRGSLAGKPLADAQLTFDGLLKNEALTGRIGASAALDQVPVTLDSDIAAGGGTRKLTGLAFSAGGTSLTGDLTQNAAGRYIGQLALKSADISTAAALLLQKASGAVDAVVTLSEDDAKQNAAVKANVANLMAQGVAVGQATLDATIGDLFGVPVVNGSAKASQALAAGISIERLDTSATRTGDGTDFQARATLTNGATLAARGSLAPVDNGYRVSLAEVDLAQGALAAHLVQPAVVSVQGQSVAVDGLALDVGGGRVSVSGTAAETLALKIAIERLPLAIANAIRPDLALGGTIDGTADITGTRAAPQARFDVQGRGIAAAALAKAGLRTISVDAKGATSDGKLALDAAVTSPEGLRATAKGAVPLNGRQLALNVDLAAFPLSVLNAAIPGQGLGGALSGSAVIGGTLARPTADFKLAARGVSASALKTAGIPGLDVQAAGRFADNAVELAAASVTGPQGLKGTASGRVPLSGSGLQLAVKGDVPLSLANRALAERGAQAAGRVTVNVAVSGSLSKPEINGSFGTQGASLVDPQSNIRLTGINVSGAVAGQTISLRSASAKLSGGGTVSVSGTVSLAAGLPADLRVRLTHARYADGTLVVATVSGDLSVTGPVTGPLIAGSVSVERAEITVPDTFGGGAAAIDVKHKHPPREVARTLARAKANEVRKSAGGGGAGVRLDIAVNAPARVFVRGRGLDAELGGSVRLTGPVSNIQPVGAFKLRRGRLSILGQRITFDEGTITLVGDLDPFLNFVARTNGDDIAVFVTVSGRASDIKVDFSSQPNLPQDEVLARLIFKRGIGELSPLQIAQLAAAAQELAGGSDSSLLGSLRASTGLDDLDVATDSQGNAVVRAGRYVQDNIYLGVEAGAGGDAKGTINLDVTEDLKVRGTVGSTDTGLGVFYEKDY